LNKSLRLIFLVLFLFLISVGLILNLQDFDNFNDTINNREINSIEGVAISAIDIYTLEWNKTWGGLANDNGYGIAADSSGNLFITGDTNSYGAANQDAFLLKYDSSGNLEWNKTWGGSNGDHGLGIAVDASGNVFITGYTSSYGAGNQDAFLLKYDSSGNLEWNKTWGGSLGDFGRGVAVDSSGNIFITGDTNRGTAGPDVFLLKYDSSGNFQWEKTWGGFATDIGRGVAVDGSGNVFITGHNNQGGNPGSGADVFLFKYDSSGIPARFKILFFT